MPMTRIPGLVSLLCVCLFGVVQSVEISNNYHSASATLSNGSLALSLSTKSKTALLSNGPTASSLEFSWSTVTANTTTNSIVITGSAVDAKTNTLTASNVISIFEQDSMTQVGFQSSLVLTNPSNDTDVSIGTLDFWYSLPASAIQDGNVAEFAYSPSIKFEADDFVPHWQFKNPSVMLEHNSLFVALVADITDQTSADILSFPPFLDLVNDGSSTPRMSVGAGHSTLTSPNVYGRSSTPVVLKPLSTLTMKYFVFVLTPPAPTSLGNSGFTAVSSFLWEHFGRPLLLASPSQQTNFNNTALTTFESYRNEAWHTVAQEVYSPVTCAGPDPCGSIASDRIEMTNGVEASTDSWFTTQYQSLRSAYGMLSYAESTGNATIQAQAESVLSLALSAPQFPQFVFNGGPFPSIFTVSNGTSSWVESSGYDGLCRFLPSYDAPELCTGWYHVSDNSNTAFWMLQMKKLDTNDSRTLPYLVTYAQYLGKIQHTEGNLAGGFSSYHIFNRTVEEFVAFDETVLGAETAMHALFLLSMYESTGSTDFLDTALGALDYLTREVVPDRQWRSSDLFFGASNIDVNTTDEFTGQHPESNLGQMAAAAAFLSAYQLTHNGSYLATGQHVLAYMTLGQSVVNHPVFDINTVGGFTTQNTNAQWNDARQAFAADVLFQYYTALGDLEYLERGIAALRASLPVAPYSSWAVTGSDNQPGPDPTSFTYGLGSAVASIEFWMSTFGQAFILVPFGHAVGLDGCTLSNLASNSTSVSFDITTDYTFPSGLTVIIETSISAADSRLLHESGVGTGQGFQQAYQRILAGGSSMVTAPDANDDDDDRMYSVVVNGHLLGSFSAGSLSDGLVVPPSALSP